MSPGFGRGFFAFYRRFLRGVGKNACWRVVFCVQHGVKRMVNVDGGLSFCMDRKKSTDFGFIFEPDRERIEVDEPLGIHGCPPVNDSSMG
jgi:hypothetical protein